MIHGPQTNDRPFMAVDTRSGSARRGRLYVSYNGHLNGETGGHDNANFRNSVALQSSDDRGRSFATFVAAAAELVKARTRLAADDTVHACVARRAALSSI